MKILSPKVHGYIDYLVVAALFACPSIFKFSATPPAVLCYVIAVFHLGLSLLTAYPMGVLKAIPFQVHGAIEFLAAFGFILAPWLLGFADNIPARNFFVASAVVLFAVWGTTDYKGTRIRMIRTEREIEEKRERKAA